MMADREERIPSTIATELNMNKVIVTCVVPGLKTAIFSNTPKNATVSVKLAERGFDMTAVVKDKSGETTWQKVIKELPASINIDKSGWKAEKDKVVITLVKETAVSWAVQLGQKGLEQIDDE